MITVTVTGLPQVEGRLKAFGQLRPALKQTVERETIALQAHVVADKLSGQVLHVRTGTLGRSITAETIETADAIEGAVGTNVRYARIHEYGGTVHLPMLVPRRARALRFEVGGQTVFARRTRAHDVRIPERSYLRSALEDRRPTILAAIRATLARVAGGQP